MHPLPAIIDIEASGFGRGSYPIEIGYVLPDGEAFCSLITPESGWQHWDVESEQVHKITRNTLQQHGRPARQIAEHLNQTLAGKTLYSDGWNNDYSWMAKLFDTVGLMQNFRIEPIYALLKPEQEQHWHATKNRLAERHGHQRHRASSDALLIQQTYGETLTLLQNLD